jgi:hypothetical protein
LRYITVSPLIDVSVQKKLDGSATKTNMKITTAEISKPVQAPATKEGTWFYMALMKINGPYTCRRHRCKDNTNTIHLENLEFAPPTKIFDTCLRHRGKVSGAQPKKRMDSPVRMTEETVDVEDDTWSVDVSFDESELELRMEVEECERREEKKCVSGFEQKYRGMEMIKDLIKD